LICRVYNLGQDNMGFRIYIDPYSMHMKGELEFTPDAYAVTPTGKSQSSTYFEDLRAAGASAFECPTTVENPFSENTRQAAQRTGFGTDQAVGGQFGGFGAAENTRPGSSQRLGGGLFGTPRQAGSLFGSTEPARSPSPGKHGKNTKPIGAP
jgi:hypothetical protein